MRRLFVIVLILSLSAPTAAAAWPGDPYPDRITAHDVARVHERHGHVQHDPGHSWAVYQYEAAVLRLYLRRVAFAQYVAAVRAALVRRWLPVARCESGDNVNAVSSSGTYLGWLQFDRSSWTANGGPGSPLGQPRGVAAQIAENYRRRSGTSPWPVCGDHFQ